MLSATQRSTVVHEMESSNHLASVTSQPARNQEITHMSKAQMLVKKTRGATMVEYALLIIAIMFLAAIGYRNLGKTVKQNAVDSDTELKAR